MKSIRILAILTALLLVGLSASAQLTTGNLTGTVTSAGAALPGVTVTVSSPNLQGTRTAVTDSNGTYNLQGLPPGNYNVSFELSGMATVKNTAHVSPSQTARMDAELKVSAVTETITVTASAPAVMESTQVQSSVTSKLVDNLPMGRTLVATTNLTPNVTPNGPNGGLIIAGGQSYDSTFYVDGAVVNEVLRGQPNNLFIEDALQETTVQTGAISAEFGRFTGGVVTAVSKNGGNQFTGSLRDTVEKPSWTAQTKFKPFVRTSNNLQSTYEGTFGGPIVHDRLWFFTAARYFAINSPAAFAALPTDPTTVPYNASSKEKRFEGKLSGQITQKHSLTGTYFNISNHQTNNCQIGCLDPSALQAPRSLPNKFYTANYNGVITNNFVLEADYAKQLFSFVGGGGFAGTPEAVTPIYVNQVGSFAGGAPFCGNCSPPEQRNNRNEKLKGSYFWSPKNFGTHNVSVGVEDYTDFLRGNNEQSGSNFFITTYNTDNSRDANGNLLLNLSQGNGYIGYWPILQNSVGNKVNTRSLFVNDTWDFSTHLSANIGARYDKNHATNQAGALVANDSKISPRIGATYDVAGNGKFRINGSYSVYTSKIAEGNIADVSSPAGAGSYLYWYYYGPDITNATPAQMRQAVFNWFNKVGGLNNKDYFAFGGSSGVTTVINGTLKSPNVREYTLGAGTQLGPRAFLRADYQYRKWSDFYTQVANTTTGTVFDPLANQTLQINQVENTNDLVRNYRAIVLQGGYRPFQRLDIGGNWTYAKLRGNITGETGGSGPVTTVGPGYYPEFYGFAQNNPVGYLPQDERNKIRAWVSYDQPTPIGNLNISVLHRFDSGTPYGAAQQIYLVGGPSCATCTKNTFGYPAGSINAQTTGNYYFTARDQYRTANLQADDLALNYSLPVSRANFFVEAKAFNVFNRQAVIAPNTTVNTSRTSSAFKAFNPFTTTPIECPQGASSATCKAMGANWQKGANFGKPTTAAGGTFGRATAGSIQFPRTYRLSFGLRF
jgi:hypothetical protein